MASRSLAAALVLSLAVPLASSQTFAPELAVSTSANGANCLIAADVDGDGLIDLVGTENNSNRVVWYRQKAAGVFSGALVIDASLVGAWHVRAADFDGDGDNDVVATGAQANAVHYLENLGGSWKKTVLTTNSNDVGGLALSDLDGDGELDILAASDLDNTLAVFWNNGGTFTEEDFTVSSAWAVTTFDSDGDGDEDIFVGGFSADTIYVMENLGGRQFAPAKVLFVFVDGVSSLRGRDLDGDGDLDILSASRNDSTVAWYPNDGAGGFGPEIVISTSMATPYQADAADVDDDGDLDIFVAASGSNAIAWFEGQGGGSFGGQRVLNGSASGARYVSIADLDGDDDLDLLGASNGDNTFGVYRNILPLKKPKLLGITGLHSLLGGQIVLTGENLQAATVTVDGVAALVTGATESQLTFDVQAEQPGGSHDVALENEFGISTWPGVLKRFPALELQPTGGLGETVDLVIDNGDIGGYVLAASGSLFVAPAPFTALGWFYGLELNGVWIIDNGLFTPGDTVKVLALPVVTDPALVGVSFYLQAWTSQTTLGYAGFTGTASITVE